MIRKKYPRMANYLTASKCADGQYAVRDHMMQKWVIMTAEEYRFLRYLNGKRNPFSYPRLEKREIKELLRKLDYCELLRKGRLQIDSIFSVRFAVYFPLRAKRGKSVLWRLLNGLLLISFIPVLAGGIFSFLQADPGISNDAILPGAIGGMFIGMVMHELGHAVAALASGGHVFEIGVSWRGLLPGAYVLIDEEQAQTVFERIQISAAGVEMNFLLAGIFLLMNANACDGNGMIFWFAVINGVMGLINLLFSGGMDGAKIMECILGVSLYDIYMSLIEDRENIRARIDKANENAAEAVMYMMLFLQFLLPIIGVAEITYLVGAVLGVL